MHVRCDVDGVVAATSVVGAVSCRSNCDVSSDYHYRRRRHHHSDVGFDDDNERHDGGTTGGVGLGRSVSISPQREHAHRRCAHDARAQCHGWVHAAPLAACVRRPACCVNRQRAGDTRARASVGRRLGPARVTHARGRAAVAAGAHPRAHDPRQPAVRRRRAGRAALRDAAGAPLTRGPCGEHHRGAAGAVAAGPAGHAGRRR
jgi:hypothetical protein